MGDSLDILLRLLLDRGSVDKTEGGMKAVSLAMEKMIKQIEENNKESIKQNVILKDMVSLSGDLKSAMDKLPFDDTKYKGLSKDLDGINEDIKKQTTLVDTLAKKDKELIKAAKDLGDAEDKQQKRIIQNLNLQNNVLSKQATIASRVSGMLNSFGSRATVGGLALGGGIIAEATAYAVKVEGATEGARKFNAELEKIRSARGRIDEVLVTAVLPLLTTASKVATLTAGIIEKNPEIASFALKGAALLVAVGTLAKIAGTGFKLYADATFFTAQGIGLKAAQMQLLASENQLIAAGGKAGGLATVATGTAASIAATVVTTLAVIAAGGVIGAVVYDILAKQFGLTRFKDIAAGGANIAGQAVGKVAVAGGMDEGEAARKTLVFTYLVGRVFGAIEKGDPAWQGVVDGANAASAALTKLGSIAEDEAKGIEILAGLAEDEAKAERKYADDREGILTDASRSLADSNRSLDKNLSDIASSLSSNIVKIKRDLKGTLADLATSFAESNLKAESEYQKQRADIITSGAKEAQDIQQKAQEALANLEKDHLNNVADLTEKRDALGLFKENAAFADKKNEISEKADRELAQARANTNALLAEAARNYQEQRAQRQAEYAKQREEAKARALEAIVEARQRAADEKKRAEEKNKEEKADIERRRAQALADLKRQSDIEQRERVLSANAAIKQLGGALNAEVELRRKYYSIIQSDLNNHLAATSRISGIKPPVHDYSGYAYKGLYAMAQDGQRQYVLSGSATRALESMVGGKLNQSNMQSGVGGGQVVWNDYRRFDSRVSKADRDLIKQDTLEIISMTNKKG